MKRKIQEFGLVVGVMLVAVLGLLTGIVYAEEEGDGGMEIVGTSETTKNAGSKSEEETFDNTESTENVDEAEVLLPKFFIKAINPGYKIDDVSNVGEMIEIGRKEKTDTPVSLAGVTVGYTNSSGNFSTLFEFPENSWMTGETVLLRLASSLNSELAAATYTKTLAFSAELSLFVDGEEVDKVCWTGKKGCYKSFSSAKPTTLVRDLKTGEFKHEEDYKPEFRAENYRVTENHEEERKEELKSRCWGLEFSEILSYYESMKSEQFIEFHNTNTEEMNLEGCKIRYKNKKHILSGTVPADGYLAYRPEGFNLTKNPVNLNEIELIDADEKILDSLVYMNGQKKGTALALLGYDGEGKELWRATYMPTPGEPNHYQEYKTCEAGKILNKETGNCVKATSVTTKICKEGYYLNILTGRCNKKKEETETKCKEGYYLHPETKRCRRIQENKGADYSLEPENFEENSAFIALFAVLGVAGVGGGYLIYEFRGEIRKFFRRWFRK